MKAAHKPSYFVFAPAIALFLVQLLLAMPASVAATEPDEEAFRLSPGNDLVFFGGVPGSSDAVRDSVLLMGPWGSGAPFNGQFQNISGSPDWNGWESIDLTQQLSSPWHVDTYNAENLNGNGPGNKAAWCGSLAFPACTAEDQEGGYGNDYNDTLNWFGEVADKAESCTVTIDAWVNHNTEPEYDFTSLQFIRGSGGPVPVWLTDGLGLNVHVQGSYTYGPGEYVGDEGNLVHIQWRVTSDSGWSDEDCEWFGNGACQIDDITVTMDNGTPTTFFDFEDGTLGDWEVGFPNGAGDFASLRTRLDDIDPCNSNMSPQVTFIDDGLVVPGTDGSPCITWCYGPGGYIVSPTGGLNDMWTSPVHNAVVSPAMPFPQDKDGCLFSFDVYAHEDLSNMNAPGIFFSWQIRSTTSADPNSIESEGWQDRDFVYYGPGEYRRVVNNVSDLLLPGAQFVQVRLTVIHIVYVWGWCPCLDGTPAPYFDNVRVDAFDIEGPALFAYAFELAQDSFPSSGGLDLEDLGANSARFDRADELADEILLHASPLSPGAVMSGMPLLHYRLAANPVFDPYRTSGLPFVGQVPGVVDSELVDQFAFDLPDTGFLFPGDILHYYFEASDELGGDLRTAILPADTTGFSDFTHPLAYSGSFTFRALPTVNLAGEVMAIPDILLWDNTGDPETLDEWYTTFANLGLEPGLGFDVFTSKDPSKSQGNGLGGLATVAQIAPYEVLAYSGGVRRMEGMGVSGPGGESSPDLPLLDGWLRLGNRGLLLTGDQLADNLKPDSILDPFLADWAGVEYQVSELRPLIDDQYSPEVAVLAGNPIFSATDRWIVYAMCPRPAILNGIVPTGTGVSFASYLDPDGNEGTYPYSAGVWNSIPAFEAQVVFLPFDFSRIGTSPAGLVPVKADASLATRTLLLDGVLDWFGHPGGLVPTPVPGARERFTVDVYPNPFNPTTRIEFNLPGRSHLSLKVFDLRGALVRTLVDEVRAAGPGFADWNGRDESGARTSSGAYFYVIKAGEETRIGKMIMLK